MNKTREMVLLALFGAIILVLTFTPFVGYIPLGTIRATTVHIPVIIGSIILGPKKGGILGFIFGLTSLYTNTFSPALTSFVFSPFVPMGNALSLVICFVPRILVGVVPYFVYRALREKSQAAGLLLAGVAGSMTNTLLVMHMIYFFFGASYGAAKNVAADMLYKVLILPVIGINGVAEAIVAAILASAICAALKKTKYVNF